MSDSAGQHTAQVTRMQLLELVEGAFTRTGATKEDIVATARDHHANPAVLQALDRLDPNRKFATVRDMWADLPDLPVD